MGSEIAITINAALFRIDRKGKLIWKKSKRKSFPFQKIELFENLMDENNGENVAGCDANFQ